MSDLSDAYKHLNLSSTKGKCSLCGGAIAGNSKYCMECYRKCHDH